MGWPDYGKVPHVNESLHPITDDGRRLAEAHEVARAAGASGRWLAIRLADGQPEGDPIDMFDTFADLARHFDDAHHAALCVNIQQMPPAEGTAWLAMQRNVAAAGYKLTDPRAPRPVPRLTPGRPKVSPMFMPDGTSLPPKLAALLKPHLVPIVGKKSPPRD